MFAKCPTIQQRIPWCQYQMPMIVWVVVDVGKTVMLADADRMVNDYPVFYDWS